MNKKLIKASVAGAAALALAAGGTTFAAFSDFGTINGNELGAGILKLDLQNVNGQTLSGETGLDFGELAPGNLHAEKRIWLATNSTQSTPNANLAISISNLKNLENNCSTNSERAVDNTCATVGDRGELSDRLSVQGRYFPTLNTAALCGTDATPSGTQTWMPGDAAGSLNAAETGTIVSQLKEADTTTPLVLSPGEGICVGVKTYWDKGTVGNADNKAQGDSMTFDIRFDLTQA